jgi:hypothetical protein
MGNSVEERSRKLERVIKSKELEEFGRDLIDAFEDGYSNVLNGKKKLDYKINVSKFSNNGVFEMVANKKKKSVDTSKKLKHGEKGGTRIGVRTRIKVEIFDSLGWCAWGEASTESRARSIAESNWPGPGKIKFYEQVTYYRVFGEVE